MPDGLSPAAAGGLDLEPPPGATALVGGRPAASHSKESEAGPPLGWFGETSPGPSTPPGLGHGLPVRRHSRLRLVIPPGRRCMAKDELTSPHPAQAFIGSDYGPEFIVRPLRGSCKASGTTTRACIEPGCPWENGFAASYASYELCSTSSATAGSGRNSSRPSHSPQLLRPRSWLVDGARSATPSGRTRLPKGYPPWRQVNRRLQHDHIHPPSSGLNR